MGLFSAFSVFCMTSFGDWTLLPHQETIEKESLLAVYMWRCGVPFLSVALMEMRERGGGYVKCPRLDSTLGPHSRHDAQCTELRSYYLSRVITAEDAFDEATL